MQGRSLEEIASSQGKAVATARNLLKRVYLKTGVNRQNELARVMLNSRCCCRLPATTQRRGNTSRTATVTAHCSGPGPGVTRQHMKNESQLNTLIEELYSASLSTDDPTPLLGRLSDFVGYEVWHADDRPAVATRMQLQRKLGHGYGVP